MLNLWLWALPKPLSSHYTARVIKTTMRVPFLAELPMPIRPFLSGRPFDPEKISEMSAALEVACKALSLRMIDDAATQLVAEKIIELAQRGVNGAELLCAMALEELKRND
jgi:hypothetical protein